MIFILGNILLIFCLLTCMYALVKGGAAERIGSAIILVNLLAGVFNETHGQQQLVTLAIDALTAVALLVIAVRYASPWLGGVMLLYALQFALHAYYVVLERPRDTLHVILNNVDFLAVSLCLLVGTTTAWMARRRRRQASLAVTAT